VSPPVRNRLTGLVSLKTDATKNPNRIRRQIAV
jgi:hypothetical protein